MREWSLTLLLAVRVMVLNSTGSVIAAVYATRPDHLGEEVTLPAATLADGAAGLLSVRVLPTALPGLIHREPPCLSTTARRLIFRWIGLTPTAHPIRSWVLQDPSIHHFALQHIA